MFCFVDKPGKPAKPEITKTFKNGASLTWQPPKSDGGSEIFNYVVEYRVEGGFKWLRATEDKVPDTAYTVKNLKEGLEYEFRVSAENKAGVGPASDGTSPVKIAEKVGKLKNP